MRNMALWVAMEVEAAPAHCSAASGPGRPHRGGQLWCCPPTAPCRPTADVGCLQVDAVDGDKVCKQRVLPCTLDRATQDLVSLIFSSDTFQDAMQTMNIGRRWWLMGGMGSVWGCRSRGAGGWWILEHSL